MKQSLQLKLGQQLTMTPQLQQAIKLLQLSTLDLQQEIQQALDSNPLLELAEDDYDAESEASAQATENSQSTGEAGAEHTAPERDTSASTEEWQTDSLPDELPVDTQWDDLLPSSSAPASQGDDAFDGDFDARNNARDSLQDQLLWQLNLTRLSDTDRIIAMAIIDATDANGRLQSTVEDIHEALTPELDIDLDEVVAVLHCLQQFEPAGV
ncbi:MAG TPA: RNA polymerase factor sigma-54, partial [Haliea salexigens]|nr:RNA polymerase factor sigma-54 [Haliea salexigens]